MVEGGRGELDQWIDTRVRMIVVRVIDRTYLSHGVDEVGGLLVMVALRHEGELLHRRHQHVQPANT